MEVIIDAHEVHDLASDMQRHADEALSKAVTAVHKVGFETEAMAKINAPVDTGFLKGSISTDYTDDGLGFDCGPTAEYGGYVEQGTHGPYIIEARPGHYLHFGDTFVKRVIHPGNAPEPYLGPAFDAAVPLMEQALGHIADQSVSSA